MLNIFLAFSIQALLLHYTQMFLTVILFQHRVFKFTFQFRELLLYCNFALKISQAMLGRLKKREVNRKYFKKFSVESQIDESLLHQLQLEHELEGHTGCVNCLDWNYSGSMLASGSDDLKVILWNPFTYKTCATISTGHRGNIFSVKFLPKTRDRVLASGAGDHQVYIHDVGYNEKIHGFLCNARVKRLVASQDAPHNLWSASEDGLIREFDIRESSSSCVKTLIDLTVSCGDTAECKCLAVNPTRSHLLCVGANDPYVRLYDRRMIKDAPLSTTNGQKLKDNSHFMHDACISCFIPGHLHHKQKEYRRRMRYLCATYVTFNSGGNECLVNVGGEQVYLYDIDTKLESLLKSSLSKPVKKSLNGLNGCSQSATTILANEVFHPPSDEKATEASYLLPAGVEKIKSKANELFATKQFTNAIMEYNKAVLIAPKSAVLYGNRAAAYMRRNWDGDMYAALRDCRSALHINPDYVKASFRYVRCLFELRHINEAKHAIKSFKKKYSEYAKSPAFQNLEKDIKAALQTPTKTVEESSIEQDVKLQSCAYDYSMRYCGHCNTTTDIKEANYFGNDDQYIIAGSDDGSFFVWEKKTSNLVRVMHADDSIVNCLQPHPSICMLATSGIDYPVRLWSPASGATSDRTVHEKESVAAANQERMNTDPFESMLLTMGVRAQVDPDGEGQADFSSCRTS